jgi:hypothetical protein
MTRWDKVPTWIDGVPYSLIDEIGATSVQNIGPPPDDPQTFDPGAPDPLAPVVVALEGIRKELALLRAEVAKASTRIPLLAPPRRPRPPEPPQPARRR